MEAPDPALLEVLADLEREEAKLLTWGVVDAAMPEDEVLELLARSSTRHKWAGGPDALLDELLDRGLLFETPEHAAAYRTRTAEAVRLHNRPANGDHGSATARKIELRGPET